MQHFLILFLWSNLEKLDYFLKANFYNLLSWSVGFDNNKLYIGFPGGASGKESAYQCRRHKRLEFDPWVWKIPWSRKWQPAPVFLPGKFHGLGAWWATVHGATKSCTRLSDWAHTYINMNIRYILTYIHELLQICSYFEIRHFNSTHCQPTGWWAPWRKDFFSEPQCLGMCVSQ